MRITEVFSGFDLGGAEIAAMSRLKYAPPGVETTFVIASPSPPNLPPMLLQPNSHMVWCGPRARQQWEAAKDTRPDVLVINTPRQAIQLLALSRQALPCPIVIVAHSEVLSDRLILSRPLAKLVKVANQRADLTIAVSQQAALGPWCRGAMRVIVCNLGSDLAPPPTDSEANWPESSKLRLLALSRLTQPKNYSALLRAMSQVKDELLDAHAHLNILGYGPEGPRLARQVSSFGLSDLVSMNGPTRNPGDWMRQADWLLVSSVAEGGPLTIYEGAQAGLQIMATPVGAAPEVLAEDVMSILLGGSDVPSLRSGLLRLLSAPRPSPQERTDRMAAAHMWSAKELAPRWYEILARLN